MKNKITASILAIFFGGFGFHKFYLGQWFQGLIYLILCFFTAGVIPIILGFLEGILYAFNSKEWFDMKYNYEYIKRKELIKK